MGLRRDMFWALGGLPTFELPSLLGTVDVWLDASDETSITKDVSNRVSAIANKGVGTGKDFTEAISGNQGEWMENIINGRPAIVDFVQYKSGTTSSYIYMHDRSTAYAIFDVYFVNTLGGSDIINSTTNGGNTNGMFVNPFGTYGMRKTMRQADAGFTTSTDLINTWTGNNEWALDTWFAMHDVYYGYQVAGDDYSLSFNGNSPAITQLESTTSAHPSAPHNFAFTVGGNGGVHSFAEKIIMKWPTQTRVEIDADIAAIKTYLQNKYAIW